MTAKQERVRLMAIPKEELYRLIDELPEQKRVRAKRYLEKLLIFEPPASAAARRPGDKPYYIAPDCPQCGTPLVLADRFENPAATEEKIWHDEFICPACRDGIFLDWPENEGKQIKEENRAGEENKLQSWDEVKRELGLCGD